MILISPGSFMMGGSVVFEVPKHQVEFTKLFAMARYENAFDEYDLFAQMTDRQLPKDEGWGRGQRPVVNVSWGDAKAYAHWLSQRTGKRYRLPTEAEWEYAARSGGQEQMWPGTSDESLLKDYAVYGAKRTEPVGRTQANGLGLYDMSGNVSEWLEDCWHENYKGVPADGQPWLEDGGGDCGRRIIRGGSWGYMPVNMRTSTRIWGVADFRNHDLGFRLAQDLP
ncbi:MAG: formylglycine-generating enzyme family protein [Nitrospira sp.]|nr:formylglycine-generating enzyme family protein [Nitrospira sp.]